MTAQGNARDPVHMDPDGSWWFYNQAMDGRYGPYPTPEEARTQLQSYIAWLNTQAPEQVPAEAKESEADRAVAEYIRLRDMKGAIEARHKEELAEVRKQLEAADAWLLNHMQTMGVESFKAGGATVFFATEMRANIGDKGALMNHIRETGDVELLQSRVSTTVLKEWMERNNGLTPPGVAASFERTVRVRKS